MADLMTDSDSQSDGPTEEQHDWASGFLGIDIRTYGSDAQASPAADTTAPETAEAAPAEVSSLSDTGAADLGAKPSSVTASAQAIPPASTQIIAGQLVFRSNHLVSVINSTGRDLTYQVDATLEDSAGHRQRASFPGQVASGGGSQSSVSGPFNLDLPANAYTPGDRVTFICTTTASGDVTASARNTNTLTVAARGLDPNRGQPLDAANALTAGGAGEAGGMAADEGAADQGDTGSMQQGFAAAKDGDTGTSFGEADSAPPGNDSGSAPDAADSTDPAVGDAPRQITVTLVTHYQQGVRYWIQDLAQDANNESPAGAGKTLVDGETHAGGESITVSCLETALGAAVAYTRESYPYPPGGGLVNWTSVHISEGGTHNMIL